MLYLPNNQYPCPEQRTRSAVNLTNTIIDACATTGVSSIIQPMAITAVVADDFANGAFQFLTAGVSLAGGNKVAFGVFLSSNTNIQSDLIFSVVGHCRFYTTAGTFLPSYVVGRTTSSTITVSTAAPANQLQTYNTIPSTSSNSFSYDINHFVIGKYDSSISTPYCFALVIDNPSATELNGYFQMDLSFRKFAQSNIKIAMGKLL